MDGFKKRLKESIQFKLSFWLSFSILAVALLAGVFAFRNAYKEAHSFQDDMLRQMAAVLDHQNLPESLSDLTSDIDEDSRITVQYLDVEPATVNGHHAQNLFPVPPEFEDGMHSLRVGKEEFRIYIKTLHNGQRIALSQETELRDNQAAHAAKRTIMPFLLLAPLLLLLVARLVRATFKPVLALSDEIDARKEHELHPIRADNIPAEVRPFVTAINRMLERVALAMQTQSRFVADAAHELRTPLTALSLQAERLDTAQMSAEARDRLAVLRLGIERGRNLLNQLLTLAKAQSDSEKEWRQLSVHQIYRQVLADLMPMIEEKQMDIGIDDEADVQVTACESDLLSLVSNLVDNAIRYTPAYGKIDLSVQQNRQGIVLQIADHGAGIPLHERDRIFDPFYRILGHQASGSGLGLSIVKTIAERAGASISTAWTDEKTQTGFCVRICFPQSRS